VLPPARTVAATAAAANFDFRVAIMLGPPRCGRETVHNGNGRM
jgi:hypothetical protein